MSWESYCALCGSTTGPCEISTLNPEELEQRREKIRQKQHAVEAGQHYHWWMVDDDLDTSSDSEDIVTNEAAATDYDPSLVTKESSRWTCALRCLGFNRESRKGWLSGYGETNHLGSIMLTERYDPNQPRENQFHCYRGYHDNYNEGCVFPFHSACLDVLVRYLTDQADFNELDRDALYFALTDWGSECDIGPGYGVLRGRGQFWFSIPGEEFAVANPLDIPGLHEFLQTQMMKKRDRDRDHDPRDDGVEYSKLLLASNDHFSILPPELRFEILSYLSGPEILALRAASPAMFCVTNTSDLFWEKLIARDMPWFWELRGLAIDCPIVDWEVDYRMLFLWLGKTAWTCFGNTRPFLGLANRRRIWESYGYLAELYSKRKQKQSLSRRGKGSIPSHTEGEEN